MPAAKAKLPAAPSKVSLKSGGGGSASAATTPAPPIAPAAPTVNLVVATPCFGGQISVHYATSLFKLQKLVRSYSGVSEARFTSIVEYLFTGPRRPPTR